MTAEKNTCDFSRLSPSGKPGFEPFAENGFFYFHFNDPDGRPVLCSRAYGNAPERDQGMHAVREIARHPERYAVKEGKNGFYLSVRTANRREIAHSPAFPTRDEADERLRILLDILPAKTGKTAAAQRAKNNTAAEDVLLRAETSETPRHYFDLKFYPDGQGIIQYPLTQECLRFQGLDKQAIVGFISAKLTPPPVKKSSSALDAAQMLPPPAQRQSDLSIHLPFSTISQQELARMRKIEVDVSMGSPDAASTLFAFFYLKEIKNGQIYYLNKYPVNERATNGHVRVAMPALQSGLYRLLATKENTLNPVAVEGCLFQVI